MAAALKIFDQLDKATQDHLIAESKYAESYCATNSMLSNFYDCSCFSLHMLAERINRGPEVPFVNLIGTAQYQQCAAAPQIAGYGQSRCQTVLAHVGMPPQQLNTLCACTGRALARAFAASGGPDMNIANNQFDASLASCRDQGGY